MTIHCEYLPLCPVIDNAKYNTIKEAGDDHKEAPGDDSDDSFDDNSF